MIKKYDDNYIDIRKIVAVTKIISFDKKLVFYVLFENVDTISFEDKDRKRLERIREKIVKDWMEVANANPR